MLVDAVHPCLHIFEGFLVCDVEGDNHTIGLPVELICDGFESFLSGSVPDLHVEALFSFLIKGLDDVDAEGFYMLIGEFLVGVLLKDRGLANCTIT